MASTDAQTASPMHDTKPTHSTNDDKDLPPRPNYSFPASFTIRGKPTAPLVKPAAIKGHLSLLHSFAELRKTVEELDDPAQQPIKRFPTEKDLRWAWFVAFAVDRFATWCEHLESSDVRTPHVAGDTLPPLDVLMVWHSYMLNPSWYSEDCARILKLRVLRELGETFAKTLPRIQTILSEPPSKARVSFWRKKTLRAFDPFEDAKLTKLKRIRCPSCTRQLTWPYMNAKGTGYLQQHFGIGCPSPECSQLYINHSTLGARKLAEELVIPPTETDLSSYLAGSLMTGNRRTDTKAGKGVKKRIRKSKAIMPSPPRSDDETIKYILEKSNYSLESLRASMKSKLGISLERRAGRIVSAYSNGEIFSVDLVGAVIRQSSFVEKMHSLGWTEPGYFDDPLDEVVLQHCIARYHGFLDLMTSDEVNHLFLVPTLDIDLAWHTHQLLGKKYDNDCGRLVGRYVDHDDKVEENTLSRAFDTTCKAWWFRFGVQYAHCGCPVPGNSIGERLWRFVFSKNPPPHLLPPSNEDDISESVIAATHPSDHNSVFDNHNKTRNESKREKRNKERRKRLHRDQELVDKGKMDKEVLDRAYTHDPAFLLPVPLWYNTQDSVGCTAFAGNVINSGTQRVGPGSCAAGAALSNCRAGFATGFSGPEGGYMGSSGVAGGGGGAGGGGCGGGGC